MLVILRLVEEVVPTHVGLKNNRPCAMSCTRSDLMNVIIHTTVYSTSNTTHTYSTHNSDNIHSKTDVQIAER